MFGRYPRDIDQSTILILLIIDYLPYSLKISREISSEIRMAHDFYEATFGKGSRQLPYAHIHMLNIWNLRVNYHVLGTSEKLTFSMIWFDNN